MIVNVTNIEGLIRAYAVSRMQAKYPELDLTENSAFDDLFIKPMVELCIPLFEKLNSLEMMRNLENAEYMTEDELDRIGEGNYFITRKQGTKATSSLTLSFANVIEGETIVVPAGIIFQTSDGLQFQTINRNSFDYASLMPLFNASTSNYDLPVTVEALDIGTEYNVDADTIVTSTILFNTNLVGITNSASVTNGTNKASNIEYAKQIKDFYISRQLGTEPGYKSFILENFEEVKDVYVAGYKNEFMVRDIIQVFNPETGLYVDKHIGGAVDIYIKGFNYDTEDTDISLKTNFFLLSQDYNSIDPLSVSVLNNTDLNKTPIILSKTQYTEGGVNKMAVILDNTGDQSFNINTDSQIYITYDFTNAGGSTENQVDHFVVGHTTGVLNSPVKEILSISDNLGAVIASPETHYQLIKTGIAGTTQEICSINLTNFDSMPNGTVLTIRYVINLTLNSIGAVLDKEEYRLVTADILAREANAAPVNIAFKLKMRSGYILDNIKKAKITASLSNFFSEKVMDDDIEESDIISWLTTDDDVKDYIEYIALPFESFYIPANSADAITATRASTNLPIPQISYPVLNKVNIVEL